MSFTGMDIGQVRQLGQQLNQKADEIEAIMQTLTGQLQAAQWVGQDRQTFESDWTGQYCTSLRTVAAGLRDAATKANSNADQQETASST